MPLSSAPVDHSALRVLVVDDQEHVRKWNETQLGAAGIGHVTLVDGGKAAIAAVTEPGAEFDLIICDLRMPDMDGVETIRALASLGIEAGVVVTSVEEERVIESAGLLATQQGLHLLGQIAKPLTVEKLAPVLERLAKARGPVPAATFSVSPAELKQAIESREIFLVYQPKIAFRTGAFVGVEALVRWRHPDLGVLAPAVFLPVAETADELIGALTTRVLEEALDFIGRRRLGGYDHTVSVNLPSRAFEVLDLPEHLEAMTSTHGVDPRYVTIEVSEAQLTVDTVRTRDVVTRLRLKRFGLALDNFGRGASGLHRLRQTPFSELKIDREFVHGCATSASNRSIVEASLALAKSFGVVSVAEGVSDRADWNLLEELGCDQAQGFFIARPMTEDGVEAWAAQWLMRQ